MTTLEGAKNQSIGGLEVDEHDTTNEILKRASTICTIVMILMCVLGMLGNALSLHIYRGPSFRKRSINTLLAALSATDLCLCFLAIPVFSISQTQSFFPGVSKYLTGHILLFAYPVTLMVQSMSVWLLVGITIDRYLAVCHPFKARIHCTSTRAKMSVYLIVFFSIAYNFVRFWEFTLDDQGGTRSLEDSIVPLLRGDHLFMLLYQNIATLISQFFIPLIVLCLLNLQVARTILQASEQRRQLVASERREYSTAKMMLFVVIVFIFCYALGMILNLAEILDEDLFRHPIGYLLNDINNILVVINSSSSFIFYTMYSSRFRTQLRLMSCIRFFVRRFPCCYESKRLRSPNKTFCAIDNATGNSHVSSCYCDRSPRIESFEHFLKQPSLV